MLRSRLALVLLLGLTLPSCDVDGPDRPPERASPLADLDLPTSTINLPVSVPVSIIRAELLGGLTNPLFKGRSDRIDINLLATEQITEEELVKELVQPATPGYWKDVWKEETRNIQESFKCLLKPWKWGQCWRTVAKTVLVQTRIWIEPTEAVYRYVSSPVAKLTDRVYKTGGWVHYAGELRSLDLQIEGQAIRVTAVVRTNVSIDYEQAAVPLGPKIKIKGALAGNVDTRIVTVGVLSLTDEAVVNLSIDEGQTRFEVIETSVPGAVEAFDILSYTQPQAFAVRKILSALLPRAAAKAIQKMVDQETSELNVGRAIRAAMGKIHGTHQLGDEWWLVAEPEEARLSNIRGSEGRVAITAGIVARFRAVHADDPPAPQAAPSIRITVGDFNPEVSLRPKVEVAYESMRAELERTAAELAAKKFPDSRYSTGSVMVFPSGSKLVVGLDINEIAGGKSTKLATIYFWGQPKVDTAKRVVSLDDFDFHLETRRWLLKNAAWVLQTPIREYLAERAVLSYAKELTALSEQFSNLQLQVGIGELKAQLRIADTVEIGTGKNGLQLRFDLTGVAALTLDVRSGLRGPVPANEEASSVSLAPIDSSTLDSKHAFRAALSPVQAPSSIAPGSPQSRAAPGLPLELGQEIAVKSPDGHWTTRLATPAEVSRHAERTLVIMNSGQLLEIEAGQQLSQ